MSARNKVFPPGVTAEMVAADPDILRVRPVDPNRFWDELEKVLDANPVVGPNDAAMRDQARVLLSLRESDPSWRALLDHVALAADADFVRGTDSKGELLQGGYRYTVKFPKGALPLVDLERGGFWSLTMYDQDYTCWRSRRMDARKANWLPAPAGQFALIVRAYVPTQPLIDGKYTLPNVERDGHSAMH